MLPGLRQQGKEEGCHVGRDKSSRLPEEGLRGGAQRSEWSIHRAEIRKRLLLGLRCMEYEQPGAMEATVWGMEPVACLEEIILKLLTGRCYRKIKIPTPPSPVHDPDRRVISFTKTMASSFASLITTNHFSSRPRVTLMSPALSCATQALK